jgi:hypothetical protein
VSIQRRVVVNEHLSTLEFVKLKQLIVLSDSDSSSDGKEENLVASVIRPVLETEPLDEEENLFNLRVGGDISTPSSPGQEGGSGVNSLGFQRKEKSKELGKKERKQMIRKDNVTTSC